MLPGHPQQAAEIRLPVHGRLLICGRGGETLRVWLSRVFLSLCPRPLGLQLGEAGDSRVGSHPETGSDGERAGEKAKKRILSIL